MASEDSQIVWKQNNIEMLSTTWLSPMDYVFLFLVLIWWLLCLWCLWAHFFGLCFFLSPWYLWKNKTIVFKWSIFMQALGYDEKCIYMLIIPKTPLRRHDKFLEIYLDISRKTHIGETRNCKGLFVSRPQGNLDFNSILIWIWKEFVRSHTHWRQD